MNPFNMVEFIGNIDLTPAVDTWTRTITIEGGLRTIVRGEIPNRVFARLDDINRRLNSPPPKRRSRQNGRGGRSRGTAQRSR